jgi:pyruvate dehydrogenase E2 component (dihydrolipoamide acetyltransferase)
VVASPLAKTVANERGIDLSQVKGSGPNGRVIKQDVDAFVPSKPVVVESKTEEAPLEKVEKKEGKPQKPKGFIVPENPFVDISLSSMRKTIANRLSESKQTIPHYYVSSSIEMGATNALRNELNKREKENGVKISINDIIVKAMALALRDYPDVNVQWQGSAVRRFKYADVSVAVAIEGGLVTPIVFRADTLGLLDIARRTKDIAKRARDGKLDPTEFIGGTSTVSNLGMFGINTVTSIINPPQATILGVGKTEKKILFQEGETPYRVAEVMDVIASVDHRAVDGALAAQWLNRIKLYLEHPTSMLL